MTGNTVRINNFAGMEWYVPDSKMGHILRSLHKHGIPSSQTVEWEKVCLREECENIEKAKRK